MKVVRLVLLLVVGLAPVTRLWGDDTDLIPSPSYFDFQGSQSKWHEQAVKLPPYPAKTGLVPLQVDDSPFKYFIDPRALTVGAKDRVVRYTVVIVSSSGVRNVRYEGLRCDAHEYKTYAFGVNDGPFQRNTAAQWQEIHGIGTDRYRADMLNQYACNGMLPRKNRAAILYQIKYASSPVEQPDYH
ncbi:MAG: CNP1-like family protein [Gammaproteobacteria bacterium]